MKADLRPAPTGRGPQPYRVTKRLRETHDTTTLVLEPSGQTGNVPEFIPGQFNMLYAFGIGEVPISMSGDPNGTDGLVHTIRSVGTVTRALGDAAIVGVRGPFGTGWPLDQAEGHDVLLIAGGLGLSPLRPALYHVLTQRERYGRIILLYGARDPAELLYTRELEQWRGRFDLDIEITVDRPMNGWRGNVGVVPSLLPRAPFDPGRTIAMVCGPEIMQRFTVRDLDRHGVDDERIYLSLERNMKCAIGFCGHCQFGPTFVCKDGPVVSADRVRPCSISGSSDMAVSTRPKMAVWKFASCDGCQLSLIDSPSLMGVAEQVEVSYFLEVSSATADGPYDLSIVEGSISTPADARRIREIREASTYLVTIGACATSGGIQALRNFASKDDYLNIVYASPEYVETLATSTPISDHVRVDFELHGCPIDRYQVVEVIGAYLHGRKPNISAHSVCFECKRRGTVCVMVSQGVPCLGPVTHAGCGALCPAYNRGCYGCFGPMETPNAASLSSWLLDYGESRDAVRNIFRTFTANAEPFREESLRHDA